MLANRFVFVRKLHSATESTRAINGKTFPIDSFTNITPSVLSLLNRSLYKTSHHPICLLKDRVFQFFYNRFVGRRGNPLFSVHDTLDPIVTVEQNFDSLLVPKDHPCRSKNDCYYLNRDLLLRAHMTAHQSQLIKMGLNNFLMVGDVFRKDKIDSTHYPAFHQLDGVRLFTPEELFAEEDVDHQKKLVIMDNENGSRSKFKQEAYTEEATQKVERELKFTLEELSKDLFGPEIQFKWVDSYFPFTHPSWELEILFNDNWTEMLGCGLIEHQILKNCGCSDRIGWAFGLGLERLAMLYYSIPDIRLFWTKDPGFHCQFKGKKCTDKFKFKELSIYPACPFDISFWVNAYFEPNDFFDTVREVCGDIVEQVNLIDKYKCNKTQRESYCFRVVYRSMVKTFTKEELRKVHADLEAKVIEKYKVTMR